MERDPSDRPFLDNEPERAGPLPRSFSRGGKPEHEPQGIGSGLGVRQAAAIAIACAAGVAGTWLVMRPTPQRAEPLPPMVMTELVERATDRASSVGGFDRRDISPPQSLTASEQTAAPVFSTDIALAPLLSGTKPKGPPLPLVAPPGNTPSTRPAQLVPSNAPARPPSEPETMRPRRESTDEKQAVKPAASPKVLSTSAVPARLTPGKVINLNSATKAEIELLPDIGPALAQRILDYRAQQGGRFKGVEDIDNVRGIGPKLLAKIRPLVVVE